MEKSIDIDNSKINPEQTENIPEELMEKESLIMTDITVEEVSIDGICGVY